MAVTELRPRADRWHEAIQTGSGELRWRYDRELDVFSITLGRPRPAVSVERDDGVVFRVELDTNEISGVEIYDFERVFLQKYPQIAAVWRAARDPLVRRLRRRLVQDAEREAAVSTAREAERYCCAHHGER